MHGKPGLGARKCAQCGARIEGAQAHLVQVCPHCRSPLYGRFVPAPATLSGTERKGSGIGILLAFAGFGFLTLVGAGAFLLLRKKPEAAPVSAPASASTTTPTPVLAEIDSGAPDAGVTARKPAGRSTATAVATVSVRPPPTTTVTVPVPSTTAALVPAVQRCSATVTVGRITPSSRTCSLNEKVSTGPTTLDFPCEGGVATARFSTQEFRGFATSTVLSLSHTEIFPFAGCRVESRQVISGSRKATSGIYTYSERIVSGSCPGASTCTARATVEFK